MLRARLRALLDVDVRQEAASIDVPVLALRAKRDRVVPAAAGEALLRCLPRVTPVDLDGPHLLLQVASEAATVELRRFIGGLPARR